MALHAFKEKSVNIYKYIIKDMQNEMSPDNKTYVPGNLGGTELQDAGSPGPLNPVGWDTGP